MFVVCFGGAVKTHIGKVELLCISMNVFVGRENIIALTLNSGKRHVLFFLVCLNHE